MLPIVVLSLAWVEANGWSPSESAKLLLDIDRASAIPAGEGHVCPRCRRHPGDSEGYLFDPESATATPEQVKGRAFVKCLCRTVYSFAAVHPVDVRQPIGQARVHAASELQPVVPPLPEPPRVLTNRRPETPVQRRRPQVIHPGVPFVVPASMIE